MMVLYGYGVTITTVKLGLGNHRQNNSTDTTGGNINIAFLFRKCYKTCKNAQSYFDGKKIVDVYWSGSEESWCHALDESGQLWGWGHNQHGEIGVGNNSGTYYYTKPTKIGVDFNRYGGIKLLKHYWSDGSQHASIILDGEGYIWFTGYQTVVTHYWFSWLYRNISYWFLEKNGIHMNGDIDYFWIGGDENRWFYIRQKSTGMLWYTMVTMVHMVVEDNQLNQMVTGINQVVKLHNLFTLKGA